MPPKLSVGFLGAGTMATALAKSFVQSGLVAAKDVIASDPLEAARASFAKTVGARTTTSNVTVVKTAEVVILAVKPDQVAGVLAEIRGHFTENHLLISIAAGVPLARLETELQTGARLIRVMPNASAVVNAAGRRRAGGETFFLCRRGFSNQGIPARRGHWFERERSGLRLYVH
jgi:pyrroline-5-carboxylate reductase